MQPANHDCGRGGGLRDSFQRQQGSLALDEFAGNFFRIPADKRDGWSWPSLPVGSLVADEGRRSTRGSGSSFLVPPEEEIQGRGGEGRATASFPFAFEVKKRSSRSSTTFPLTEDDASFVDEAEDDHSHDEYLSLSVSTDCKPAAVHDHRAQACDFSVLKAVVQGDDGDFSAHNARAYDLGIVMAEEESQSDGEGSRRGSSSVTFVAKKRSLRSSPTFPLMEDDAFIVDKVDQGDCSLSLVSTDRKPATVQDHRAQASDFSVPSASNYRTTSTP